MLKSCVFFDEITVWWERFSSPSEEYEIYLDGGLCERISKTHYTFSCLESGREYSVKINVTLSGKPVSSVEERITTKGQKKRIDVSGDPYFAVADGATLNTAAIQRAIDDSDADSYVYFPAGRYLTGALDLHSNTELYIDEGAVLLGSESPLDYLPKIKSRFEGCEMECYRSLINIGTLDRSKYTVENVIIRGKGAIYGGGAALAKATIEREREALKEHLLENAEYVKTCENEDTIPGRARGRLINISSANGVVIAGLALGYSASWNVHFIYSKNITTYGCSISSRGVWNGDGWDPDSSEDAVIFDTTFDTHDNAIAIKSGKNPEGNEIGIPTRNIRIFDCRGKNDIAIGSELSGGVDGVYVRDCHFFDSWGINIKTTPERGGYIKNIDVRDSDLSSITIRTRINFNNDNVGAGYLTDIHGLRFENLLLQGVFTNANDERTLISPISIDGFDDENTKICDVTFKNIKILPREDGEMQTIKFRNVKGLLLEDIELL